MILDLDGWEYIKNRIDEEVYIRFILVCLVAKMSEKSVEVNEKDKYIQKNDNTLNETIKNFSCSINKSKPLLFNNCK